MFLYRLKRLCIAIHIRFSVLFISDSERRIYKFDHAIMMLDSDADEGTMTFFAGFHEAGMSHREISPDFEAGIMFNSFGENVARYVTNGRHGGTSNIKYNIFERVTTARALSIPRNKIIPVVLLSFLTESHHSLREKDLIAETYQAVLKFSAEDIFDLLKKKCDIDTINKYGASNVDIELINSMLESQLESN